MTDNQIVALFWERSEMAIQETSNLYGRYFHRVAYGILGNNEDAEEIVNDTYVKAWNNIPPQRPVHLKAFLARITRQLAINRLEQNTAQKRGDGQYRLVLEELQECLSDGEGEAMPESVALEQSLNQFLRALPIDARRMFIRRYWHMQSVKQIARELCVSESRVKVTLMRARQKLKKHLVSEGFCV